MLLVAYVVVRGLALATESTRARAFWAAMTVPAFVVLLVAASLTRAHEAQHQGPFVARAGPSVPMSFSVAHVEGVVTTAFVVMTAEVRGVKPVPALGTEAVWVEGYVSGAGDEDVIDPRYLRQDLRPTNDLFARALDVCCRVRPGLLRIDVSKLLQGAPVSVTDLLRDGRLDLVVGTHTEVRDAALVVCWNEIEDRPNAWTDRTCQVVPWSPRM